MLGPASASCRAWPLGCCSFWAPSGYCRPAAVTPALVSLDRASSLAVLRLAALSCRSPGLCAAGPPPRCSTWASASRSPVRRSRACLVSTPRPRSQREITATHRPRRPSVLRRLLGSRGVAASEGGCRQLRVGRAVCVTPDPCRVLVDQSALRSAAESGVHGDVRVLCVKCAVAHPRAVVGVSAQPWRL